MSNWDRHQLQPAGALPWRGTVQAGGGTIVAERMPWTRPLNLVWDVSLGPVLLIALARRAASWAGLSGDLVTDVRGMVSLLGCCLGDGAARRAGFRAAITLNLSRP